MLNFSFWVIISVRLKELCLLMGKLTVARHTQCEAHLLNLESSLSLSMICLILYIRFISNFSHFFCNYACKVDFFRFGVICGNLLIQKTTVVLFYDIKDASREFLLRMSYLEIYNEDINDLLAPEHRKLQIHENLEVLICFLRIPLTKFSSDSDVFFRS